jgi:hypothetical protein
MKDSKRGVEPIFILPGDWMHVERKTLPTMSDYLHNNVTAKHVPVSISMLRSYVGQSRCRQNIYSIL